MKLTISTDNLDPQLKKPSKKKWSKKSSSKKKAEGILYVLIIKLEDKELIKVGVTTRRIEERVCEILTEIWKKYRIFPECYVKRYRTTEQVYALEADMHLQLKEYSYTTQFKFSGCTEFFLIDIDTVTVIYDKLIPR